MTDRPILFNKPMVRALLDGRKTQTRRVLKPQPRLFQIDQHGTPCQVGCIQVQGRAYNSLTLGHVIPGDKINYAVGDRLWVKETWGCAGIYTDVAEIRYRASERASHSEFVEQIPIGNIPNVDRLKVTWPKYVSPLHMRRVFSRITLIVTDVRVERLQDISEADAISEGAFVEKATGRIFNSVTAMRLGGDEWRNARDWYADLWGTINGQGAWDANPWVVAISFDVHLGNIDKLTTNASRITAALRKEPQQ